MKFFSKILKHKKFLFFVFLIMILMPTVTYGAWSDPSSWVQYAGDGIRKIGETAITAYLTALLLAMVIGPIVLLGALSNFSGSLLLYIINPNNISSSGTWSYTHFTNPIIAIGWTEIRDLANMIIVLGFVVIGIATALRFQDYEAKKLLPKLIGAAIMINFSLVICGIIIDGSNILMNAFLTNNGGFLADSVGNQIGKQVRDLLSATNWTDIGRIGDLIGAAIGIIFFDLITTIIFLLFFFLFLFRYIMLWILVIFSPLAFVFYVFPGTNQFFKKWWDNFLQWCIIGIVGAFFIYLANKLNEAMISNASSPNHAGIAGIMLYLVPCALLIGGLLFSLQSGAMGAGIAISAFKKSGSKTLGAAKELTGRNKHAQELRENMAHAGNRFAELVGLAPEGHTEQQKNKRAKDAETKVEALRNSSELGDKNRYNQLVRTGRGAMGAAAVSVANKNKELDDILGGNITQRASRVGYATAFGYRKEEFAKVNPDINAPLSDKQAEQQVREAEQTRLVQSGMSIEEAKKQAQSALISPPQITQARSAARSQGIIENALNLSPVTDTTARNKLLETKQKELLDSGISASLVEKQLKIYGEGLTAKEVVDKKQSLSQENLSKGFAKLDVAGIRGADKAILSHPEFLKNVGAPRLDRAMIEMSQDKVQEIKKHIQFSDKTNKIAQDLLAHMRGLKTRSVAGDKKAKEELSSLIEKYRTIKDA